MLPHTLHHVAIAAAAPSCAATVSQWHLHQTAVLPVVLLVVLVRVMAVLGAIVPRVVANSGAVPASFPMAQALEAIAANAAPSP